MSPSDTDVFLSWSGERSQAVAKSLRDWLPQIINAVRPWMSTEDIRKGTRWNEVIGKELAAAKLGIICLTPENTSAPWLLFEAGALAKIVDESYVCPYLVGMRATDVPQGPLTQFQATLGTPEDTLRLLYTLNSALSNPRRDIDLDKAFAKWWPELEGELAKAAKLDFGSSAIPDRRSAEDMLDEVLTMVRQISQGSYRLPDEVEAEDLEVLNGKAPNFVAGPSDWPIIAGSNILHPKFGRGAVVALEGNGDEAILTISFPHHGLKKIVKKFAGLPLIEVMYQKR